MRALLYRAGAALVMAAAIIGMFTVIGYPVPLGRQILIAVVSATAVQIYIEIYSRRRRNLNR